jgi:uncharacterized protein (DUF1778 family)
MSRTITVRLKDPTYTLFKRAAEGAHRTLSNFVEYATLVYLTHEVYVSDEEMEEIQQFSGTIRKGKGDIKKGKYTLVS